MRARQFAIRLAPITGALFLAGCPAQPFFVELDAGTRDALPFVPDTGIDAGVLDSGGPSPDAGLMRCQSFERNIQTVFSQRCAFNGCHGGFSPSANLNLSAPGAYSNIVGVRSDQDELSPPRNRVQPFSPETSYLYLKLTNPPFRGRMPLAGSELDVALLSVIRSWIAQGAPPGEFEPCELLEAPRQVGAVRVTTPPSVSLEIGQLATLTATVADTQNRPFTGAVIIWRSTNERVLYIDGDGRILGLATGLSDVIAQSGGVDSAPFVVSVNAGIPAPGISFATDVAPMMTERCALPVCHIVGLRALHFDVSAQDIYDQIVLQPSMDFPQMVHIRPNAPFTSFLFLKLIETDPPVGRQMPQGIPRLTADRVQNVLRWISEGAPNN